MRIKMLKHCMVTGFGPDPVRANKVIESDQQNIVNEFKALVSVGYAAETKDPVTVTAPPKPHFDPIKAPPKSKNKGDAPENKGDDGNDGKSE